MYGFFFMFFRIYAALLGGSSGLFLRNMINKIKGIVTIIASFLKNSFTSDIFADFFTKRPGSEAPRDTETKVIKTFMVIILGTDEVLNQLVAMTEGVLRINTLPIAANPEPTKHQAGR